MTKHDELIELQRINDLWAANSRETWQSMQAMRDSINEHIHMPSVESDLLQGPESSVFCETVARCVVDAIRDLRTENEALRSGAVCAAVKPLEWHQHHQDPEDAVSEDYSGRYCVFNNIKGTWTLDDGEGYSVHETLSEGKEAAFAEKARRILSALTIRPEAEVRNEGFALGWYAAIDAARAGPISALGDILDMCLCRLEANDKHVREWIEVHARNEICKPPIVPPADISAAIDAIKDTAWKAGAEAMREGAAGLLDVSPNFGGMARSLAMFVTYNEWKGYKRASEEYSDKIRALPVPERKKGGAE